MPLTSGQVLIDRYRIISLLGQGGFGAVYKAWDLRLNGPCAIKENFKLTSAEQQQFAREASLLFKLNHPNLPRVFDQFDLPGEGQYLVMDYIDGQDLAEVIQSKGAGLSEATCVAWVAQVCEALEYLHSQHPPVIHRDIKPSNIKITPQGRIYLVDFGIAKTGLAGQPTTAAARGVTPGYSPPEQYGRASTDARTDIYALGATLYSLLTGEEPPASTDRIVGIPLERPRQLNQSISPAMEAVILKAMAIEPGQRYATAAEFRAALLNPPAPVQPKPSSPLPMRWIAVIAGIILLLCLVVGAVTAANVIPGLLGPSPSTPLDFDTPVTRPSATLPPEAPATAFPSILPGTTDSPTTLPPSSVPTTVPPVIVDTLPPSPLPATPVPALTWQQGRLAFLVRVGGGTSLFTLNLVSGDGPVRVFSPSSDALLLGPAWSPNGDRLAFAQLYGDLRLLNTSGSVIWSYPECDVPSWSPNGTQIICHTRGTGMFNILDSSSGNLLNSFLLDSGAVHPSWSPARDEITFSVIDSDQTTIWRAGIADGSPPVLLAGDASENYAPSWSPDGEWIAFQSTLDSPLSDLWVMDRNGSGLRRVLFTDSGYWSRAPSFSPDGQWLAFVSNQVGSFGADYGEIFVVSLVTGEVVQVTDTGGMVYDWRVDWTP